MDPVIYQILASRTECSQLKSQARFAEGFTFPTRLNHAVIGLAGEVGEMAAAVEKWMYYGQGFDGTNFVEELGDALWYIAQACNAMA